MGAKWKALTDADKAPYLAMAEKDKVRYKKEKAIWDQQVAVKRQQLEAQQQQMSKAGHDVSLVVSSAADVHAAMTGESLRHSSHLIHPIVRFSHHFAIRNPLVGVKISQVMLAAGASRRRISPPSNGCRTFMHCASIACSPSSLQSSTRTMRSYTWVPPRRLVKQPSARLSPRSRSCGLMERCGYGHDII